MKIYFCTIYNLLITWNQVIAHNTELNLTTSKLFVLDRKIETI